MALIPDPQIAAANAARRQQEKHERDEKLKHHDIDSDWLDAMVKRLFDELDRQMKQVEESRTGQTDSTGRAANARTLASLERTLERLARTERERAAMRNSKAMKKDGNARAEIERKISRITEIEFADGNSGRSDGQ